MSNNSKSISGLFYIPENDEELKSKITELLNHTTGPEMLYLYYLMEAAGERGFFNKTNE